MKPYNYEAIRDVVIDKYGRHVVLALFTEFNRSKFKPLWSLYKDWKPVFLRTYDVTEYSQAMECIGDWDHYQLIRTHHIIKPIIDGWMREAEIKLRSESIKKMVEIAENTNNVAAVKWLAEGAYMRRVLKNTKDRQDEEEVREGVANRVAADMERLGLRVVNGGK